MFIANEYTRKNLAPLGAKPGSGTIGELAKAIALLRNSLQSKETIGNPKRWLVSSRP